MKKILKISCLAIIFWGVSLNISFAQKFGHLHSANILVQLPETKKADEELKTYQDGLVKTGRDMAEALRADYEAFAKLYQGGGASPAEAQKKEAEFTKKQQDIAAYEQEVLVKLEKKRQELFEPILNKVQVAIDAIGKDEGYTFIFDSSIPSTILFLQDSDDISSKVLAKLGL